MSIRCRMTLSRLVALLLLTGCCSALWDADAEATEDQCDLAVREIVNEDRATVVDESPSRLHAVWISQECEIRAGPEYVIRKYTFFENGTFLLLRHYYAEESCSIATHSVTARGAIKILGNSVVTSGASEARYQLDSVHVSPLNRQVAHKLGHRVNVSCGPQPRWRPYVAQVIYERAPERFGRGQGAWHEAGSRYNSLQGSLISSGGRSAKSVDCLAPLGLDFDELRLLRVQRRPTGFRSVGLRDAGRNRLELLLASLPPETAARRTHRPTSLQPTALLRTDTIHNCPICGAIARGTENSPPLLHEVVALPALLGGSWISPSCESHPGGVWLRRQLRVYAGDKLWTGRWDYFGDARCSSFLYSITAAGSYVQRARRHRRHNVNAVEDENEDSLLYRDLVLRTRRQADTQEPTKKAHKKPASTKKEPRPLKGASPRLTGEPLDTGRSTSASLASVLLRDELPEVPDNGMEETRARRAADEVDYYRDLLQNSQPAMAESFAAMLRGNQRRDETTKRPLQSSTPTGTTELDLHVAESLLIAGDLGLARRCGAAGLAPDGSPPHKAPRLSSWPPSCVPHSLDAPSTLGLRARVGVDWYGQYTLLLGARDGSIWDAPLLHCGPTSMRNPLLRAHLRRSVGLRFGILFSGASSPALSLTPMILASIALLRLGAR